MNSKYKILIVDDEPLNVELLSIYIEDTYDVITSYNGKEALEKVKKESPDLILLDVMMPDMNGYDVCRVIRNEFKMDFIPIIMVTALTDRADHQKGIDSGADEFLKKPVSKFELEKKITSLLRIKEQHDNLLTEKNKAYYYLDYVGVLVAVLDLNYRIMHINKKGYELLGVNPGNLLNNQWIDSFVPQDYAECIKRYYNDLVSGTLVPCNYHEYPVFISNGDERVFRWCDSPIEDEAGNISGILISGEDITEIKDAEKQLKEYACQLERSNDLKDLFTDVLRHDLINPAGLIKSFIELLNDMETDCHKKELFLKVSSTTDKLISMIDDAAHFAKLESLEDISFTVIDISSMIRDVVNGSMYQIKEKDMDVQILSEGKCHALSNPMIERVFVNLLSNSIKYSPRGSTIIIEISEVENKWKIGFTDRGEGIPDKSKSLIFERFTRLHKEDIKGTGIGLAIVKRIMDLHQERVFVEDNPQGTGSIFWLTLKKAQ